MRILFISNFYPPASRGGYEQWCQEVAEGLRDRGHQVFILTSTYRRANLTCPDPAWVQRGLFLEMEFASYKNAFQFFTLRKQREQQNLALLRYVMEEKAPEIILIWGMWNLPRSLPALAETLLPGRVVCYIGDYWPTLPSQFDNYWNAPARNFLTGFPKMVLKPFAKMVLAREQRSVLRLEHALFPSTFMRDELARKSIIPANKGVIYGAIDTKNYRNQRNLANQKDVISLLYIGRLTHEKGVHTAIDAVGKLVREHGFRNVKLTIVGDGEPDYIDFLHQLVGQKKVVSFVDFWPAQPKETLPKLYHASDIFLFTSIWPEPFGRVIVEAMASGVVVVGTSVGGAAEILSENENALLFTPDDPVSLSKQLKRLIESPQLRERLAASGRETAVNKFDIQRMTSEIETYLQALVTR